MQATTAYDTTTTTTTIANPPTKRQKLIHHHHQHHRQAPPPKPDQLLIPGLPDHVAQLCLSLVHPSLLYSVCHSWRRLIYSPSFPPFLSLYTLLSSTTTDSTSTSPSPSTSPSTSPSPADASLQFLSFDPISSTWQPLPPPPESDPPLRPVLRHPSFISRLLPIQSVSVSGRLILLAASTDGLFPAFSRPLVFNPLSRTWTFGPPLATPRRWCAAGAAAGALYVASGIGSQFSTDVAKSVEKWSVCKRRWRWDNVKGLKDGKFCREAIDAVGWRGKLCMVNVKGDSAKEGVVYDVEKDAWEEMPKGMVGGWRGPVAAMDEEVMYAVDEANGALIKYDSARDDWDRVMESEKLVGAQQIAAGGGRVCVVCSGGGGIVVVDVVALPARVWVVETPPGFEAVAVHILPRMSLNPRYTDCCGY
ncbi:hypothetical protein Tsubulata_000719 [Turnera subulata]|uniref:F-box domain-containing protein n=1 Tax=Turnera subulata TaxID=218843 RepID=A0A9Q0F6W7_9ROSI|nr:hypothetical protein Tsubulata_000719 [Turnera subulata]